MLQELSVPISYKAKKVKEDGLKKLKLWHVVQQSKTPSDANILGGSIHICIEKLGNPYIESINAVCCTRIQVSELTLHGTRYGNSPGLIYLTYTFNCCDAWFLHFLTWRDTGMLTE